MTCSVSLASWSREELLVFSLLTVEQAVELLRIRQSLGMPQSSARITMPELGARPNTGKREE
jgi:hypothetical protein